MTTNDTTARASVAINLRSLTITDWLSRKGGYEAELTLWPLSEGTTRHRELHGRVSISIRTGGATLNLWPTADEARELIAALHWALGEDDIAAARQPPAPICVDLVGEGPV